MIAGRTRGAVLTTLAVALGAAPAAVLARPTPPTTPAEDEALRARADAVARAPRPEDAGGMVVPRERRGGRTALRIALFVPRALIAALLSPVRLTLWVDDRYHVAAWLKDLTWNDARTIGVYPVATWEGGKSVSGGAAFAATDVGGTSIALRATTGTNERALLEATIHSGSRFGALRIEAGARYREVLAGSFYGYGDGEVVETLPMTPIDPITDDFAIDSRFSQAETMARGAVRWRAAPWLALKSGASYRRVRFDEPRSVFGDDLIGIADAYDPAAVPGYLDGVDAIRGEVAAFLDCRCTRLRTQSKAAPSSGFATELYGGWQQGIGDDPRSFAYGGVDAIGHLDLYGGDRVVSLRVTVDTVFADLEDVPFIALPTLGGNMLRGYWANRFRDRWTAAASLEYAWPVTEGAYGFVFGDAGRAARDAAALAEESPRASAGVGLQLHSKSALAARLWVAVTREGSFLAALKLDTSFANRAREVAR